jgi:hypothetical protein
MGIYKVVHKNTFNYSTFKRPNTTHSSGCNFCMRQKDKATSYNLCSAVLGKMRLLIPCIWYNNVKNAFFIIILNFIFLRKSALRKNGDY